MDNRPGDQRALVAFCSISSGKSYTCNPIVTTLRSAQQDFLYVALTYRDLKWYLGQVNDAVI